jgi:antitoxin (DNA-binding transcriptional repressor) of toxin-antitoxin stability system
MQAVTIREAKARLSALVEAAEQGEHVVLMRGAKHVALIVALSADLEVAPRLTDGQAERLWARLAAERRDGSSVVMDSPGKAVAILSRPTRRPASPRALAHRSRKSTRPPRR